MLDVESNYFIRARKIPKFSIELAKDGNYLKVEVNKAPFWTP